MIIGECKGCGRMIFEDDDLTYGCPRCECPVIGEYTGIIGRYTRNLNREKSP